MVADKFTEVGSFQKTVSLCFIIIKFFQVQCVFETNKKILILVKNNYVKIKELICQLRGGF